MDWYTFGGLGAFIVLLTINLVRMSRKLDREEREQRLAQSIPFMPWGDEDIR